MENIVEIISHFRISGGLVSTSPYGTGHINETIASVFESGGIMSRFIHQRINHNVFKEPKKVMHNIEKILPYLHQVLSENGEDADRGCLTLVPAVDGKSYWKTDLGNYWRTYKMIENASTYDIPQDISQVYQAAYAFGKFQKDLAGFPADVLFETIPDFHNTPKRFNKFLEGLKTDPYKRTRTARSEIQFILEHEALTSVITELLSDRAVPLRITHNDTKLNNVLMDDHTGKGICVIDLDTVMPGSSLYDFGDMVRSSTATSAEDEPDIRRVGFNQAHFAQLVRGYLAAAQEFLTPIETEYLADAGLVITLEQAIRFLSDYLNGDTYYKINYTEHNLVRARTQIRLIAEMEQALPEIKQIISNYL